MFRLSAVQHGNSPTDVSVQVLVTSTRGISDRGDREMDRLEKRVPEGEAKVTRRPWRCSTWSGFRTRMLAENCPRTISTLFSILAVGMTGALQGVLALGMAAQLRV